MKIGKACSIPGKANHQLQFEFYTTTLLPKLAEAGRGERKAAAGNEQQPAAEAPAAARPAVPSGPEAADSPFAPVAPMGAAGKDDPSRKRGSRSRGRRGNGRS